MEKVFVSSVMRGFEQEREAARQAIESVDARPLMAETAPASADPSKTALLDLVAQADAVVLVLGARYGYIGLNGRSPTEDEFRHAQTLGRPVFVFVQNGVEREPEQEAFLRRIQGSWEEGAFTAFFDEPSQLGFAIVKALTAHRNAATGDGGEAAAARALELAGTQERHGTGTPDVRVVIVPVGAGVLLDALALDDAELVDRAAGAVRESRLVSQAAGIDGRATSQGIRLEAKTPRDFGSTRVVLAPDGAVIVAASVPADGGLGGLAFSYPRVQTVIEAATTVAGAFWRLLPAGDRVRQVATLVGVPATDNRGLSESGNVGGSVGMPSIPSPVLAPNPPLVVGRAELASEETRRRLAVSVKQAFADHNAFLT